MKNNFKFKNFIYNVNDNIVTKSIIEAAVLEFYRLEVKETPNKFAIIFKMQTTESGDWRNISSLQIADNTNIVDLVEIFNIFWSYRSDHYHNLNWSKIVFRYRFLEHDIEPSKPVFNYPTDYEKKPSLLPDGYKNLPNNRSFETWGDMITILDRSTYFVEKNSHSFHIRKLDNEYFITVSYKNKKLFEFHDLYDENLQNTNTFLRRIGKFELYYHNGKCNFLTQTLKTKYITRKNRDISIKDNFITMDLETRNLNNVMHVISASIFDGKTMKSYYLTDYDSSDLLLKSAVIYLLQRKYNGYRVYLHNFSNFDGIFLLRILAQLDECIIEKSILRDGKIIDLKLSYNLTGNRKYSINIRDSLLLLPSSLKKLGDSFDVEIKKTIYPYKFVNNPLINLDYVGEVPDYSTFPEYSDITKKGVTHEEYLEYKSKFDNNNWSLRKETIKYCENDVRSLYSILKSFQKMIFRLFEADINNSPTLSSLAFNIYRMKYLKKFQIPVIEGEIYRNLQESYTGGNVDVYIPTGKNVNRYDVNSLYPAVMSEFASPVGKIKKFRGNILDYESNPFGFFYVNIKAPNNLHIPILQTRVKTNNGGIRTVSPLGEWSGWYFSEEIFNALKYGYKIDIVWGYTFEKEYIFKEYVTDLYKLKRESEKDSSSYTISKLLLNSLYGRFGMSPDKQNHMIIKGELEIGKFLTNKKISVIDSVELADQTELISYRDLKSEEEVASYNNISVSIASSITAYARIKMSEIKTLYSNNIYYSDTDSIDLDVKLPSKYISENLGDFKFEKEFKEVVYIAPKVYAAITDKGKEFIKIKGFKDNIEFDKVASLVNQNFKLKLNQEKWYKNMQEGNITTKVEDYTLMATENKRKLIYANQKLVKTVPYKLIDGKLS